MERSERVTPDVDVSHPNIARSYDFYLGGRHNFEADRDFARRVLGSYPDTSALARDNRGFVQRAIRLMSDQGVDQFLDLGSGLATGRRVDQIAHALNPAALVIGVDNDPVVLAQSGVTLRGVERVHILDADLREPDSVLTDAVRLAGLDLRRPVGVLLTSILHFLPDEDDPAGLVARYLAALARPSYVAISHALITEQGEAFEVRELYRQLARPMYFRTAEQIAELFGPSSLVDPGLVLMPRWRPEPGDRQVDDTYPGLAGVGRT